MRDRVKELRRVKASDLVPNPKNWRTHPEAQANALRGILDEVGYADALLARELPDGRLMLVDGHLGAETTPEELVPVLVLDVTEAEAEKLLLTLDPLAAMAGADTGKLDELLREVQTGDALGEMLKDLARGASLYDAAEVPAPSLESADKAPFQQMTFTLHDSQALIVRRALESVGCPKSVVNANSNGNALAALAEAYLGSR